MHKELKKKKKTETKPKDKTVKQNYSRIKAYHF